MSEKIEIMKNGPYKISGKTPFIKESLVIDDNNEVVDFEKISDICTDSEKYLICRCGHSKNFPFCDGEHIKAKFNGKETASTKTENKDISIYKGKTIDILDNISLCAGIKVCLAKGTTWELIESSDPEDEKLVLNQVSNCSSGRLVAKNKDGKILEPNLKPSISLVYDPETKTIGPIWVKGGIKITSANGEEYEVRNRVTLCCCGESKNKPFCDRAHFNCDHMKSEL